MEALLKIFRVSNPPPTVPAGDDEIAPDADEPPDDQVPGLKSGFKKESICGRKGSVPGLPRRESLLTRAIRGEVETSPTSPRMSEVPRGMSTTSSHSFASTAELTSDVESPARSASPSPPPPRNRLHFAGATKSVDAGNIVIAPTTKDDKPTVVVSGEAAVEKTLGRKRCIMFACKDSSSEIPKAVEVKPAVADILNLEPAPRKCRISFACAPKPITGAQDSESPKDLSRRQSSPVQATPKSPEICPSRPRSATEATLTLPVVDTRRSTTPRPVSPTSPKQAFHEFASSHEEPEDWVQKASELAKPKLTIDDCLRKENAIRKIGKEAEEEAEAEEREREELDDENRDDEAGDDDFAPSDDDAEALSDEGNESDNEEGFAESDDESDGESEYQFWAPTSTATKATSTSDNINYFSAQQKSRSRASSTSSAHSVDVKVSRGRSVRKSKASKPIRMRPGTPELPDSTDFVCGTFDEDRPLEAAYVSCREQKRREKHVLIPQDIDPSFPTTDPEDEVDDEDDEDYVAESSDALFITNQFEGFDEDTCGRRPSAVLVSPLHTPAPAIAPPRSGRPVLGTRSTCRSPPPKQNMARSPAPRRLFDQPARRLRSPLPTGRLNSPRGSPTGHNTDYKAVPFGITISHLAQRPNAVKTSSLPHTPNPFFRNWKDGSQGVSRITSAAVTPGTEELPADLYVRGPVAIVIGLEKKRQKRKEKYWRQHCRKAAKEHAEKRPPKGRGVERMKELGLECAERTRGYGLGQPAQHVLSL